MDVFDNISNIVREDATDKVVNLLMEAQSILTSIGCDNRIVKVHMELVGLLYVLDIEREQKIATIVDMYNAHYVIVLCDIIRINTTISTLCDIGLSIDIEQKLIRANPNLLMLLLIPALIYREEMVTNMVSDTNSSNASLTHKLATLAFRELDIKLALSKLTGCAYSHDTRTMLKTIYSTIYVDGVITHISKNTNTH